MNAPATSYLILRTPAGMKAARELFQACKPVEILGTQFLVTGLDEFGHSTLVYLTEAVPLDFPPTQKKGGPP